MMIQQILEQMETDCQRLQNREDKWSHMIIIVILQGENTTSSFQWIDNVKFLTSLKLYNAKILSTIMRFDKDKYNFPPNHIKWQ